MIQKTTEQRLVEQRLVEQRQNNPLHNNVYAYKGNFVVDTRDHSDIVKRVTKKVEDIIRDELWKIDYKVSNTIAEAKKSI